MRPKKEEAILKATRSISTATPIEDVWRSLRFFMEESYCVSRIMDVHPDLRTKQADDNVRKQATQVGFTLKQAEEYFTASQAVGPRTRAVLLYYGVVCLSHAVVLINGNGTCSFDFRRREEFHNHHGLLLCKDFARSKASGCEGLSEFLSTIGCKLHLREDGKLWGQFPLFSDNLSRSQVAFVFSRILGNTGLMAGSAYSHETSMDSLAAYGKRKISLLEMTAELPDMYHLMKDLDMKPRLCRLSMVAHQAYDNLAEMTLFFYDIDQDGQRYISELFSRRLSDIHLSQQPNGMLYATMNIPYNNEELALPSGLPYLAQSLTGEKFSMTDSAPVMGELRSIFASMFTLGMLSRYHPDIWVRALERSSIVSDFMDSLFKVVYRKAPLLVLDQLTGMKHCINYS